jgi:hypothetical protein
VAWWLVTGRRDRRDQIVQQKGLIDMTDRMFRTELMPAEAPSRRRTPWLVGITVTILILIVLGFVAVRLSVDVPSIAAGTVPDDAYDARFVRHPWLTYLHIGPGVLYMVALPSSSPTGSAAATMRSIDDWAESCLAQAC